MNRRAALFLLLYLAVILYLSLYPWRFVPHYGFRIPPWIPIVNRRAMLDAGLNLMFYVPLGAAAFGVFRRRNTLAFLIAFAFGSLGSLTVELVQGYIPTRVGSLTDLLFNSAGTLLGVAIACVATSTPLAPRVRKIASARLLLLGLWVLWQALLFLPRYRPAIDINQIVAGWLMLVLLLIPWQNRVIAFLLLAWLTIGELQPFQFVSSPHPFLWLPFESWFVGAPDSYYGVLFGKLFSYTLIVWVERRSGIPWIWALAAPGLILGAGEFAQCYLPGRTPEITDLVLLAAGAMMLYLMESHNKEQT